MEYFEQRRPITIIFGSFFVVLLPLAMLSLIPNFFEFAPHFLLAVVVGLGGTHFFITLLLYLQSENLDYFAKSTRNRIVYFGVPLFILLGLAMYAAMDFDKTYPLFSLYFFAGLRIFDFAHVGRQSFGMLQLFKRPAAKTHPAWSRRLENVFFLSMALMQWETYLLGGRFRASEMHMLAPALVCAGLFFVVVSCYARSIFRSPHDHRSGLPLTYFAMQSFAAALAVYDTRLYAVGLVLHYVEYHVIMSPRCFKAPLRSERFIDRVWGHFRNYPVLVYGGLLVIASASWFNYLATPSTATTTFFVHLFDGIFLVHYFIEAFLWKFQVPFYRDTLAPLYFRREETKREPSRSGIGTLHNPWLQIGAVSMTLALVWSLGWLDAPAQQFERRVIGPMQIESHERWGRALVAENRPLDARPHIEEALRLYPDNAGAKAVLRQIDAQLLSESRGESESPR